MLVFEARSHRLEKSLSDLAGTDPHIHDGTPAGVLRALSNALSRRRSQPEFDELLEILGDVSVAAQAIKKERRGGSLFEAKPFRDLVFVAQRSARVAIGSLRR
jgi:hypothetical protein